MNQNSQHGKAGIMSGIMWNILQMLVNQTLTIVIRLVLAKLLFPEQFGIVGMALVFTNLVQMLNDIGINAALVQKREDKLTDTHYHTAFWSGICWSVFLFLLMTFFVGPFAASFYKEPLLKTIIPVMSIGILINPINLVQQAQLTRRMDFKKIASINSIASITAGFVSLLLAFSGAGIWALVVNTVATYVLATPLYLVATKYKPRLEWKKEAFREIFGFGLFTTGTSVIGYTMNNADYFFIGKMLNAEMLGLYTLAFMLTDTFRSKLMTVMNNVMYPVYSQKQEQTDAIKRYYIKVVKYNSIVVYPVMLFFMLFASPLITHIFGEKWAASAQLLQILSGAVMLHMLVNSNTVLIRGMGKASLEMKLQLFKAFLFIPSLAIGTYYYGITGAAWAVLINKFLAVVIAQYTFNKLLNIKMTTREFMQCWKVPVTGSLAAAAGCIPLLAIDVHYIPGGIILITIYGVSVWLMMKDEIKKQLQDLKALKKKKTKPGPAITAVRA